MLDVIHFLMTWGDFGVFFLNANRRTDTRTDERTDGRTVWMDGRTDGQTLISRCEDASKKYKSKKRKNRSIGVWHFHPCPRS